MTSKAKTVLCVHVRRYEKSEDGEIVLVREIAWPSLPAVGAYISVGIEPSGTRSEHEAQVMYHRWFGDGAVTVMALMTYRESKMAEIVDALNRDGFRTLTTSIEAASGRPPETDTETWQIEVRWNEMWLVLQGGFASQGDAEWATAQWKQLNNCTGDPFRATRETPETPVTRRPSE